MVTATSPATPPPEESSTEDLPWELRGAPMSPAELNARKVAAASVWTGHAEHFSHLQERIRSGQEKIAQAWKDGIDEAVIKDAELRLAGLSDEAAELRRRYAMPAAVLGDVGGLVEVLNTYSLPEGSFLTIVIPEGPRLSVALDDPDRDIPF